MHDAVYEDLFSQPRMVEDLLRGFVAPEWSDALDFSTLEKLPAEYVSDDLQRRHGDLVWRLRLREETWLYPLVMLEFQSTTDRHMAVRILVCTGLPYQDLIRRGAFGDDGRLPPVLPVVPYDGRPRWTAPVEAGERAAPGRDPTRAPTRRPNGARTPPPPATSLPPGGGPGPDPEPPPTTPPTPRRAAHPTSAPSVPTMSVSGADAAECSRKAEGAT